MRKYFFLFLVVSALSGCAHPRLMNASPGVFTLGCNDCSEKDWRYAAAQYCTVRPQPMSSRTITGLHSSFIKYRPVKTRTFQCRGQIIRHP